jgi:hypothetical protein
MNDGKIWPVGYCYDAGGSHHDTKEEAEECYRKYLLDNRLQLKGKLADQQHRCQICQEYTDRYASVDHMTYPLCDKHRNREQVEQLFGLVGEIISS